MSMQPARRPASFARGRRPNTPIKARRTYVAFAGTLTDENLKFETRGGYYKYEFKLRPDGIMEGRLATPATRTRP